MTDTITVRGFTGTDPDHKQAQTGNSVLTFRLGSTPRWRNQATGEWTSGATNWYTVACFGRLADNVRDSIGKGDPVVIVGRPKIREWENDQGIKGTEFEITAQSISHDLNYGRTQFVKVSGATSGIPDAAPTQSQATEGVSEEPAAHEGQGTGVSSDQPEQQIPAAWDSESRQAEPAF